MTKGVSAVKTRTAVGLAVVLAWCLGTTTVATAQGAACAAPTPADVAAVPGGDASGARAQPGPAPDSPEQCWSWAIDAYTLTADENEIVAVGDIIATVVQSLTVVALDAADGTESWRYTVTDEDYGEVHGISAGDGAVYAGGIDGLVAIEASDGSPRWSYLVDNPDSLNPEWGGFFSPAPAAGSVYGTTRLDDADGNAAYTLVALDSATGDERWTVPLSTYSTGAPASDGTLVVVEYETLESDVPWPDIGAFDAATGESRWVYKIRDVNQWPSTRPVVTADRVFLGLQSGDVVALSAADGSEAWRSNVGFLVDTISAADGRLFVTEGTGAVHALNAKTGKERWRAAPKVGRLTPGEIPAVVQDGPVIVGASDNTDGWLIAFDQATGDQLWRVDAGPVGRGFLAPVVTGGRVVVGLQDSGADRLVSFGTP